MRLKVPAVQFAQSAAVVEPKPVRYVPAEQREHVLLEEAASAPEYVPGGQYTHVALDTAAGVVLYVLLVQKMPKHTSFISIG